MSKEGFIFIKNLEKLERGDRAILRRHAGKTVEEASGEVLRIFFRALPATVVREEYGEYFLIATLFPLAENAKWGNLGDSLYKSRDGREVPGIDRRVERLLSANKGQVGLMVRRAIQFVSSKGVSVNWIQLLDDLLAWEADVKVQWAKAYFNHYQEEKK